MSVTLPQPGVEVIQEFQAASPSVITPTLFPNVVGVAKQVVPLNVSDGAGGTILNTDALIQLPGQFTAKAASGNPPVYGSLNGLVLAFSVNNAPTVSVTFVDTGAGLSPATVVSQVRAALTAAGVTSLIAETVGTTQWRLRTVGVGDFQFIAIGSTTASAVASAFGIGPGRVYRGQSAYNQLVTNVPQSAFPDPRGNLEELGIEQASIRAFLFLGSGGIHEALRTQAFLRNGEVNDAAFVTGNVALSSLTLPADIGTGTLEVSVNGGATQTVTYSNPANPAAVVSQTTAGLTGAVASNSGGFLRITSTALGASSSVTIVGGTRAAALGLAAATDTGESIAAVDDGNGDALTDLIRFALENFTASATAAVVTASQAATNPADNTTLIINDGQQTQTVVFNGVASFANILTQINAVVGTTAGGRITASDAGSSVLRLTHSLTGTDSVINIIGGTALPALDGGGTPTLVAGTFRGVPNVPLPGDELWIDGAFFATVTTVAPGAVVTDLRVDKFVPIDSDIGRFFYIVAKNLPASGRPTADLVIDANGGVVLKQEQIRDVNGNRVASFQAPVYVSYSAVRRDVSALADQPGLLVFDDTSQLENVLSPIDATNPLGLGTFFALLNAPGTQVTALGVDAISADAPFGTVEAFARAASFLEGKEVYAIAPLTNDSAVHQVFNTHVTVMSGPTNKGERVAIINVATPTTRADTLVASGSGDSVGGGGTVFDTNVGNLTALVLNAGISPIGTIPADSGLFIDIAADSKRYSIASISGSEVTIRTSFSPGENDDSYYSTTVLPLALIQHAFTVKVRGAALTVAGIPDLNGIAETIATVGRGYSNRRLWMTVPDKVGATINGLDTLVEGFYAAAGIAGAVGQNPPQQSFTRFPLTGYTRVVGSNDRFNTRQLDTMAGGGAWILIQEGQGAPVVSRFAISTDITSVEVRTDSITKVVDFTAKFLRRSLLNYIGRFNITQGFLDTLSSVVEGLGGFLVENGILLGFTLNQIIQDTDAPDTVLIDITLDPPYPCNFIRVTLVI